MQHAVERQRRFEIPGNRCVVELHACAREGARKTRHPPLRTGQRDLDHGVVGSDQNVKLRCQLTHPVRAPRIPRKLFDRHDQAVFVQPRKHFRNQVDLGVERVVVGDDGKANGRHRPVMLENASLVGPV